MKILAAILLAVLLGLQYRLWLSDNGAREIWRLHAAVAQQRAENHGLGERNAQLAAEVRDLKEGLSAVEERARSELGMIKSNETFYQVVPRDPDAAAGPIRPTANSNPQ
jgi:cell division protein FtsB